MDALTSRSPTTTLIGTATDENGIAGVTVTVSGTSGREGRSSPARRAPPTLAIDAPEPPDENNSTAVNTHPVRPPTNQPDDRPSDMPSRLFHSMKPKRKNGLRLNTRRLAIGGLEDRRLLSIMQSFDLDPLHRAEAMKPEYAPVGWLGGLNEDGTVHRGASAVLIANSAGSVEWALTAAHLIDYNLNQPGFVQMQFGLGPDFFNDPGETRLVDAWYVHPDYSAAAGIGTTPDLALVHFTEPFDVDPAVFYAGTLDYGDPVTMVGYGAPGTNETGQLEFDGMRRGGTNIVEGFGADGNVSYLRYAPYYVFSEFAHPFLGPTPLEFLGSSGDSGSGFFVTDNGQTYLAGINIFASGPFSPGLMYGCSGGALILTPSFQDWISSTINTAEPLDVTVATAAAQAPLTNADPVVFTAVFSDQVADFDASDVIASGAPGTFSYVVTPVGTDGTTYDIAVSGMTGDGQVVVSIPADAAHNAGGNGNSASTALDAGVTYDVTAPGASIVDVLTNDATPLLGGTVSDANGVSGVSVTVGAQTFAGVLNNADGTWSAEVPASLLDGAHTATVTVTDNAGNVSTDTATVTVNTHPWHNFADPCNVDGRSGVEPVDVLLIINYINAHGSGPLPEPGPVAPPPYIDVNADDEVTPTDVLLVINWINSHPNGASEGESFPNADAIPVFTSPVLEVNGISQVSSELGKATGNDPGNDHRAAVWSPRRITRSDSSLLTLHNRCAEPLAGGGTDVLDLDSVLTEIASDIAHGWTDAG